MFPGNSWSTSGPQQRQFPLGALSRQSMQAAAVHSHSCSLAPQDLPAGCQAVQQTVPTLQGAAAWAQQCQTVTDRLAGLLGTSASSTQTEQMTLHAPAIAHFQTLSQWNKTVFPRITVPIHLLSQLQAEPGVITAHISPSKRIHK